MKRLFSLSWRAKIKPWYLIAALVGLVGGFIGASLWPQQVTFSYRQTTCISGAHFAPNALGARSDKFTVKSAGVIRVGSTPIVARGLCVEPVSVPQPGRYEIAVSLPGLPFISKNITVTVPAHPVASAVQLNQPVPLSKKLVVALSTKDVVFSYKLTVGGETIDCDVQPLSVACDLGKMALKQGTTYPLRLDRYFLKEKVATIVQMTVSTLPSVTLVTSSIKEGETVYSKPRSLTMEFDKTIQSVEASLVQVDGDKSMTVPVLQAVQDKKVTLTWSDDLVRQAKYQIIFKHLKASDGSTYDASSHSFTTSGGPKVKGISVGTYKVASGTSAVLSFDQAPSEQQDVTAAISVTGGAQITSRQGSNVTISFANVPRCGEVTIKVSDALMSVYGISGGSAWQYTTRTICQSVASIGTSVKGRSILSYSFGAGAEKVVYTGAIHGDEISTRSLMMKWIDTLEANPKSIPADKTVIVIPVINPDAYAAGSRTNARNVDLNRNFATSDWRSDITTVTNKPFPNGGGTAALSEPESAALASFIAKTQPRLVLSYHSIGGLVMGNQVGASAKLAQRYASLSRYANSTGSGSAFDYSVSGTADDYYGEKLGVASILIELGSHTDPQFERNQNAMWTILRES